MQNSTVEIMQRVLTELKQKDPEKCAKERSKEARVQSGSKQWVISRLIDPAKFQKSQNNPLIEV